MPGLALALLQLAAPQAAASPPDIELTARFRAREVTVRQQREASLRLGLRRARHRRSRSSTRRRPGAELSQSGTPGDNVRRLRGADGTLYEVVTRHRRPHPPLRLRGKLTRWGEETAFLQGAARISLAPAL